MINNASSENQSDAKQDTLDGVKANTERQPSENSYEGILLHKGDPFTIHPAAQRFRRSDEHVKTLSQDIEKRGQLQDAVFRSLPCGTIEIVDGVTRLQILHEMGLPLSCRPLTETELNGRTISKYIHDVNVSGSGGRKLNDCQRAIAIVECCEEETHYSLEEMQAEVTKRQKAGKLASSVEKGSVADRLSRLANVKPVRVRKVLELKHAKADKLLFDAVWEGNIAISMAQTIASEKDEGLRQTLIKKAVLGDKQGIKTLLNGSSGKRYDKNGVSIPKDVIPAFSQSRDVAHALKHLKAGLKKLSEAAAPKKHVEDIELVMDQVKRSLAQEMCEWCDQRGTIDGAKCFACQGKRYVTVHEFEAAKAKEMEKLSLGRH